MTLTFHIHKLAMCMKICQILVDLLTSSKKYILYFLTHILNSNFILFDLVCSDLDISLPLDHVESFRLSPMKRTDPLIEK